MEKKVFCRKPFEGFLYKWSPDTTVVKNNKIKKSDVIEFCNALPYSNGEDTITRYVYRLHNENGKLKKLAYVTCGYVK